MMAINRTGLRGKLRGPVRTLLETTVALNAPYIATIGFVPSDPVDVIGDDSCHYGIIAGCCANIPFTTAAAGGSAAGSCS